MGPLGMQEMVVLAILALVMFGPRKLPELFRTVGKAMGEFQRARAELKSTFDRELQGLEKEHAEIRQVTSELTNEIHNSYYDDGSYSYHDSGAYGSEPYDNHETSSDHPATVSASATQDADVKQDAPGTAASNSTASPAPKPVAPEGTVPASSSITAYGTNGHGGAPAPPAESQPASDVRA